ncbi:hypothetical protein AVEN_136385-1 [Araneus ventricosus]|uniref:Uncharacterized protein n=1 Tax=Araneus ventricosus TaxID=182803 RepID=A0A4Y2Q4F0_ARAVE|nr:hypothetical protein AVEN_66287-1 [Araneus ventricosus]GBN59045.1 hypothetical protein AVEN_136385-1 [Araneus ventricosus]
MVNGRALGLRPQHPSCRSDYHSVASDAFAPGRGDLDVTLSDASPRWKALSRPFTSLPKWNFWNTGRKKQLSVLKTDGNWNRGMAMLKFKRTQNPTLRASIPIWRLD